MKILIVDDDNSFRMALASVLEMNDGWSIVSSESGEDAIRRLGNEKFDVIVLAGSETVAVEAMKLGAYDYVRKEMIDIDHVGITINGVYERYLFRKEKERREREEQEKVKAMATFKMVNETVASIGHFVNNALSMLSMNIESHADDMMRFVPETSRDKVRSSFDEMRQEFAVVSAGVKSMLNLSSHVYERLAGIKNNIEFSREDVVDELLLKEIPSEKEVNERVSKSQKS
jgi:ActR/RegA family two-component response regulator